MRILAFIMALLMAVPALAEDYANPMALPEQYAPSPGAPHDYGMGDPFVLRHNGRYYLYASSNEERVRVWTSRDLVDWTFEGYCTEGTDVAIAFAPEVTYWRGSFYMITSPEGQGHYILRSDDPLGPFRKVTGNFGHAIDGSLYPLDDGRLMLLYPEAGYIRTVLLDEETLLPAGESRNTGTTLIHWTEGPGLFRRGDWYYLTLTGNHVISDGYRVAWASRRGDPFGRFVQQEDSTLLINSTRGDSFRGLGHSANVIGPDLDSFYTTYHSLVHVAGPARLYNLDRLFTNGGRLYTSGPSDTAMPVPKMPDLWGDADGKNRDFTETAEGFFAQMTETDVFTQEWNFTLCGGCARMLIGQSGGKDVTVSADQTTLTLRIGEEIVAHAALPEIGPAGRLHTLRVEHTPEVMYLSVDGMRVLTCGNPGFTASRVGVYKAEGAAYHFLGCTGEALGSSDERAVKRIPGGFSAVHALNRGEVAEEGFAALEESAARLGSADYAVRIAKGGQYAFDLQVLAADAGKTIALALDGETLLECVVPLFSGPAETFTFTTKAVALPQGDHVLTIRGDGVLLNRVCAFAWTPVESHSFDFSGGKQHQYFRTMGNFTMKATVKVLSNHGKRKGFIIFGDEGYTDLALDVRFAIPRIGEGDSGFILRATDLSFSDGQMEESYYGYRLVLTDLGVRLERIRYGKVSGGAFGAVDAWKTAEEGRLRIELEGSRLTVYTGEGEMVLTYEDGQPFTHGLYGLFSTGKELKVYELTVAPLDEGL